MTVSGRCGKRKLLAVGGDTRESTSTEAIGLNLKPIFIQKWIQFLYVKGVAHSEKPRKITSSMGPFSIFQLNVVVFLSTSLMFWFTLTALIVFFSATAGSWFHQKRSDKSTVHYLPGRKTKLATSW